MIHFPVLLEESINLLVSNNQAKKYLDCTFGVGGHTKEILAKMHKNSCLHSFDRDHGAIKLAKNIKDNRFHFHRDSFKNLSNYFDKDSIDGALFDLGVCSTHLDDASRGFSFMNNGNLDMRFNQKKGITALEWINKANEEEIAGILYRYGDEKYSKLISKEICKKRKTKRITTTSDLANIIKSTYPKIKKNIHPATKSFQAIRIFLNDELNHYETALNSIKSLLKKDGVVVIISFHSLEDRITKNFFKAKKIIDLPKEIPINTKEEKSFECIAKKIRPSKEEILKNPRSRSAILRAYKKIC